ncbi:hypothetical protein [Pseudomonas fluorescens]|uniref:hypothetical protein n=1 Tax=Pseudomonas fluorescens TaxID=294 RepID=UPI0013B36E22|nr:hypothetical protein [Pseudomonas fluorescens]WJK07808.1 hypothetical protein QR290_18480 [Pseudomonas fluorescens]
MNIDPGHGNDWSVLRLRPLVESKKPPQPEGGSGQGMCLKESVHEQGDQDDDRDWNAEEKQQ